MLKLITPLELCKYWLEDIVIAFDLCPFANLPYKNGLVRIIVNETTSESDQLSVFLDELEHLQQTPKSQLSTTILVFSKDENDFYDFNDFVGLCEDYLEESGLLEHFQLVIFHPEYIFEGKDHDDHTNFVGRSPYPIIHILRNTEIEMALENYPDLAQIALKNEKTFANMSESKLHELFYYLKPTQ